MTEKQKRGFALLTPEQRRAMASVGGKALPADKRSFSANRALAAEAGRRGGRAVPPHKRSFSAQPELAAAAGRKGGAVPRPRTFDNPDVAKAAAQKTRKQRY